ncbi:MAG: tetratricopeptide repeat protein [Gammaproteobacteria bacterium]|nr:tetratricopeptide repeat protein [Gammaproteobacteria bacterium]
MTTEQDFQRALEHQRAGRLPQAEALCRQILQQHAEYPPALHLLGTLARAAGRLEDAAGLFTRTARAAPASPDAHYELGVTRAMQGDLDAAIAGFRKTLQLQPDHLLARYNLALALYHRERLEDADREFRRVLELAPALPEAHLMLGLVRHKRSRMAEAEAAFKQAIQLRAGYADAYSNLANLYLDQGRLAEAEQACRAALARAPDLAVAHYNLGLAAFRQGKLDHAVAALQNALRLNPEYAEAHINLGIALTYLGRTREALASFEAALRREPGQASGYSALLFSRLYLATTTPAEWFAACRRFAEQYETPLRKHWPAHRNLRDPGRRLKVGYVSPDFRRHSVAYFIEPILARHDRSRIEVHCYYNHAMQDETTARIAASADHWTPCKGLSDEELSERIREDGIDILVDLAGHSVDNRLPVFARRPAPVQITYLGAPASTGLDAMDYRLCTLDTDPPGQEEWHSEALYRLPRTLWCYRPGGDRQPPAARSEDITFGSLNNIAKVSENSLSAWAEILRATPAARLVMTQVPEGSARRGIHDHFAARGIEPDRIVLHGRISEARYLELLAAIDIALDPFPYTGTTTTCETLWMGIPVVSLAGETSVARSGLALLKAVGLEELVARDPAGYVRIATDLARDPARLDRLRREIPRRFDASPLRDEAAFTRDLEDAYRDMWHRWCAQDAPS